MVDVKKVVFGSLAGVALLGAGVAGGFALDQPETVKVKEYVPFEVEKPVIVEKEVVVTETVEVPVEVTVEDTELIQKLCDKLMIDDIEECRQEVEAEDEALKLALEKFEDKDDLFDLLEDEGLVADEDEVELIKVYKDFEDVEIVKSDFDDKEYKFVIEAKVEDEDVDEKKKFLFTIEVEDGEAEIVSVEEK